MLGVTVKYLRMQKMFEQPSTKNGDCSFGKPPLRSPNRLMVEKSRVLTGSLTVVTTSLLIELKLVKNCIFQALEMLVHHFNSLVCIGRCIPKARDVLKRCHYFLNLLIVLLIFPVNLHNNPKTNAKLILKTSLVCI